MSLFPRIIWHAKHYTGRGVMKFYPTGEDLAKDMGVPLQTLIDAHQKHFEAAKKQESWPRGPDEFAQLGLSIKGYTGIPPQHGNFNGENLDAGFWDTHSS